MPQVEIPVLGPKPKVKSKADLATAVASIAYMASHRKAVAAEIEPQINDLRDRQTRELQLEFEDGATVGFDAYEKSLKHAVERYVLKNKAKLFTHDFRTITFGAGTVSIRDKAAWLQYDEGVTKKSIVGQILSESGLLSQVMDWLKKKALRPWLKLTPDLDISAITAACKSGELTAEELAEYGLKFESAETVRVDPADYDSSTDA